MCELPPQTVSYSKLATTAFRILTLPFDRVLYMTEKHMFE